MWANVYATCNSISLIPYARKISSICSEHKLAKVQCPVAFCPAVHFLGGILSRSLFFARGILSGVVFGCGILSRGIMSGIPGARFSKLSKTFS